MEGRILQELKWSRGYFVTFFSHSHAGQGVWFAWFAMTEGRRYNALDDRPNQTEVYNFSF